MNSVLKFSYNWEALLVYRQQEKTHNTQRWQRSQRRQRRQQRPYACSSPTAAAVPIFSINNPPYAAYLCLLHIHIHSIYGLHPSSALVNTRNCARTSTPFPPIPCRPAFSSAWLSASAGAAAALAASRCWRLLPSHAAFFRSPECLFSQKVLIYLRRKFYILHDTRLQLHALLLLCRRRSPLPAACCSEQPFYAARLNSTHLHLSWQREMGWGGRGVGKGRAWQQPSMLLQQRAGGGKGGGSGTMEKGERKNRNTFLQILIAHVISLHAMRLCVHTHTHTCACQCA